MGRRREANDGALGRIVIVGAGALGRELRQWMLMDGREEPVIFLDDRAPGCQTVDAYERADGDEVLIAIADPAGRFSMAERFAAVASFIAASATVGSCKLGDGVILLPHSLVSADAVIGNGCVVNTYSSIGHDCDVGAFCTLSSQVVLAGRVKVGAKVFFGTGANVLPGVSIGEGAYIGAGAVVVRDVDAGQRVFGNPARAIA